jgi:hypothetical protein
MIVDEENPNIDKEAVGLELGVSEPQSITTFLKLPTVTTRIDSKI